MKSPLSQAFSVPDVHPRLRKHLARCTLDCGFKTPESPALRGFEAERCPITGTSLYLVLLSNGLHHSENLPVKFGFSLKIVPATIAKKLPLQLRPKPLFIAFFSLSHKRPTFVSLPKASTHSAPLKESHTTAHTAKQGPSGQGRYHYPRSVPHVRKPPRAGCQHSKLCCFWVLAGCTPEERREPSEQRCAYACRCPEGVAAPLGCVICLQLGDVAVFSLCAQHFLNVRGEGGITTLGALCVLLKYRTAACQNGSFAVF